ncbi:hypothetical protein [Evansella cellulosilytica]|uniref:Uncharacterized protein n=1 Tax=Evansella cellulosilytica (strain ATCC 21833 / DSM 2522 / FERM P-1141 / JCM 9156 / N-4) TaxID=649639 RepID=E6TT71_EVAC2|nr:hypothetical protein [Evansella cellulosilytica]ADU31979.1 hypothetical protein Bcell_3739 [Evansella cellulosilytica DSM 2522]
MSWYSYFLLNVPETLLMLVITLLLLGFSIKEHAKPILLVAFLQGAVAFALSIYMQNPLKPFVTIITFTVLVAFLFKRTMLQGFTIALIAFFILSFYEITFSLINMYVFDADYTAIQADPWKRVTTGFITIQLPMLVTVLLLLKFKLKINIPFLIK